MEKRELEIKCIFKINNSNQKDFLTENELYIKFSLKQRMYYNYFRTIIPKTIRKKIQERNYRYVKYNKDFIWEDYLHFLNNELVIMNYKLSSITEKLFGKENKYGIVITHDVEEQKGFDFIPEVIKLEKKYGFCSSFNIVPYKYAIDDGITNLIKQSGCEIGIHGYNHDGKLYFSEKIFNKRVPFINDALKRYGAVGFRSPMVHRNLLWLQKLNIEYDASCFDYDPFQPFPGGTGSIWPFIAGKFVELPYTLPQDHTLFYILKVKNIDIWKNKIDWIVKNNGVVLVLTHPDYLMEKNHLQHYEELLKYLRNIPNSWHCLPKDLARHFRKIIETNN